MTNNWVVADKANCVDCATCALAGKCLDPELVFLSDDAVDDTLSCYDYVEKITR